MKYFLIAIVTLALPLAVFAAFLLKPTNSSGQTGSAYDFSFTSLMENKDMPLSNYKDKVILIVNTASKCGFTGQYDDLQKLYDKYKEQGLIVIGVPSNDFGKQESGSEEEIGSFCKENYGVTFPMTSKQIVSGDDAHPFYAWAYKSLGFGTAPKWNFHKYLIDKNGKLVEYYNSTTSPLSSSITNKIEELLKP